MKRILATMLLLLSIICIAVLAGSGQEKPKTAKQSTKAAQNKKSSPTAKPQDTASTIHLEACKVVQADKHMKVPTGPVYFETNGNGVYHITWKDPIPFDKADKEQWVSNGFRAGPLKITVPMNPKDPKPYSYDVDGVFCDPSFQRGKKNHPLTDPNDIIVP
jgi:hypothetical protein